MGTRRFLFLVLTLLVSLSGFAQTPRSGNTAASTSLSAAEQYNAQAQNLRAIVTRYNQYMDPLFRSGAQGNLSFAQRQEIMAITAGGGLHTMREFLAVLGEVQDSLISARLKLQRYDEAAAIFHLGQNVQRFERAQALWRRFQGHDLALGHNRVQLGEAVTGAALCYGFTMLLPELFATLVEMLPNLAVSAGIQTVGAGAVYVASQHVGAASHNQNSVTPPAAASSAAAPPAPSGPAPSAVSGVQSVGTAEGGPSIVNGESVANSASLPQLIAGQGATAPSAATSSSTAPGQNVGLDQREERQRQIAQQRFQQALLANVTRQAARAPAQIRTYQQLVAAAVEAMPQWHASNTAPFDWGRFLIEVEASQSRPAMLQRDYDGLQERWRQVLARAREATNGVDDPILRVRAAVNALMAQPLSGPYNANATFLDCLRGQGRNQTCETALLTAALQAGSVPLPNHLKLGVQDHNGQRELVLLVRPQSDATSGHAQVMHLQTGLVDENVRSAVYETTALDHDFLTQAQLQLPDTRIPLTLQSLLLADIVGAPVLAGAIVPGDGAVPANSTSAPLPSVSDQNLQAPTIAAENSPVASQTPRATSSGSANENENTAVPGVAPRTSSAAPPSVVNEPTVAQTISSSNAPDPIRLLATAATGSAYRREGESMGMANDPGVASASPEEAAASGNDQNTPALSTAAESAPAATGEHQVETPDTARLRTINRLIREKLIEWNRTGQIPVGFDWVMLNVEAEAARREPVVSQRQLDNLRQRWQEALTSAQQAADATVTDAAARISAARAVLVNRFIHNYARDSASLITSLSGNGGNCQTSTQLIGTALLSLGLAPPAGEQYVINTYQDHVQFGTYNPQTRVYWDILTNTRSSPFRGDVYRPELMAHAYLVKYGNGISPPWPADPRLLVARSSLPAEQILARPELSASMRNTLGWPGARQNFGSATPIPAFTQIENRPTDARPEPTAATRIPTATTGSATTGAGPVSETVPTTEEEESFTEGRLTSRTLNFPGIENIHPVLRNFLETQYREIDLGYNHPDRIWRIFGLAMPRNELEEFTRRQRLEEYRYLAGLRGPINLDGIRDLIAQDYEAILSRRIQFREPRSSDVHRGENLEGALGNEVGSCVQFLRSLSRRAIMVLEFLNSHPEVPANPQNRIGLYRESAPFNEITWCQQLPAFRRARETVSRQRIADHVFEFRHTFNQGVPPAIIDELTPRLIAITSEPSVATRRQLALNLAEDYMAARIRGIPHFDEAIHTMQDTPVMRRAQADIRELVRHIYGLSICSFLSSRLGQWFRDSSERDPQTAFSMHGRCYQGFSINRVAQAASQRRQLFKENPLALIVAMGTAQEGVNAPFALAPQVTDLEGYDVTIPAPSGRQPIMINHWNLYMAPAITAMANPRQVGIMWPPRRGHAATNAPAPVATPHLQMNAIDLPHDGAGGNIEIEYLDPPQSPVGAVQQSAQTGSAHGSARSTRAPQPRQVQLSPQRFIQVLQQLDGYTRNNGLLRERWTPELTSIIANATGSSGRIFQSWVLTNIDLMAELNPGTIRGPFGRNISRDLARILFNIRRDEVSQIRGNQATYTGVSRGFYLNFAPNDDRTADITQLPCRRTASSEVQPCFQTMQESNAFMDRLNQLFGPPNVPHTDAPLNSY